MPIVHQKDYALEVIKTMRYFINNAENYKPDERERWLLGYVKGYINGAADALCGNVFTNFEEAE